MDVIIEKLFEYLDYIYKEAKVKPEYGVVCYFKDYIEIARKIPKDKIVVDVGCSFGLQQLLFKEHKKYIGIQKFREGVNCEKGYNPQFQILTENAMMIEGNFRDVWQQIGITEENKDNYFGIANHSLFHDLGGNKEDIEIFKRSFPHNYYAVDESNKIIKY